MWKKPSKENIFNINLKIIIIELEYFIMQLT